MPPASSGRYQSRLFKFVHNQSQRWGEGLGRTFRNLQVATAWSLEALKQSVFQLIQKAVESAGKQLQPGQQQEQLQLQAHDTEIESEATVPVADLSIVRVLQTFENLQLEEVNRTQGKFLSPHLSIVPSQSVENLSSTCVDLLPIQGIASQLSNRQLVLVNVDNEILDILTPQQQQILADRIITEVANYWRYWRFKAAKKETRILSEINNLLTKLTAARSKDSISALPSAQTETNIDYPYFLNPQSALALLDQAVAKLEVNALVPVSRNSAELIQVIQTQLQIFIYGQEKIASTKPTVAATNDVQHQISKIQALIWAAINFFFGEQQAKKFASNTPANQTLPIRPQIKIPGTRLSQRLNSQSVSRNLISGSDYSADPWLHEEDLFGDFELNSTTKVETKKQKASAIPPRGKRQHRPSNSQQQFHQNTQHKLKPDWIETQAKLIGYEKHPLEHILEWLDRIILGLEKIFINMLLFLQGFFKVRN